MKRKYLCLPMLLLWIIGIWTDGLSRSNSPRQSAPSDHSFCGTYPGRVHDELRRAANLRQILEGRRFRHALATSSNSTEDVGNIAVVEDDGTIVSPANAFDLAGQDLKLTPTGTGTYRLSIQAGNINQNLGTKLSLTDDDSNQIPIGFQFPFFNSSYNSVFINSDGNVTFVQGDVARTDRDLTRFNSGPPRIAVIFEDMDPTLGDGGIYYNALSDRFLITWSRVREFQGTTPNTAQLALFADGSMELTYGTVTSSTFIVGWSPGQGLHAPTLIDLSTSAGILPAGPVAESYSSDTNIDFPAAAMKFYQTHPDNYDQLAIYTNFPYSLGGDAFAYEVTIKNDIQGINADIYDYSAQFGSAGQLQSFLALNQMSVFPDNPDAIAVRTYSTVAVLAHETAHRWLAYPLFKTGSVNSGDLLGYQQAHWSFFFNADASLMEGHTIQDKGNGTFTITEVTDRFGKLDQYLMGYLSASDVGSLFYVKSPSGTYHVATDVTEPSDIGLTFRGTRADLSVNDIIAAIGPRIPDSSTAPRVFHQATILLVERGTLPSSADLNKLGLIQQRFQQYFTQATNGLGVIDISLNAIPVLPVVESISPGFGSTLGNTRVYISGNNFQNGATVRIGPAAATNVQVVNSSLIVATTGPASAGVVNVVVTNPGAQPVTLSSAY
ncbi:MAG TPA: IPT/TIG domain-containing protein, partial [Terriglobia bacterium]|nr:IPT/TIG domain-containing protein [Terriglobia bacterium]